MFQLESIFSKPPSNKAWFKENKLKNSTMKFSFCRLDFYHALTTCSSDFDVGATSRFPVAVRLTFSFSAAHGVLIILPNRFDVSYFWRLSFTYLKGVVMLVCALWSVAEPSQNKKRKARERKTRNRREEKQYVIARDDELDTGE